ncbi:uncharacterized protein OCT59_018290 [Rhizophagus irregularis]|uniref:uncharacterized protein n=1 Tax=Rhizophagus irregularis TaxID=588596 RepID=UPI00331BDBFD|nr:hypothetical protein OCT59_018290 [Rhizophagus irregularis]
MLEADDITATYKGAWWQNAMPYLHGFAKNLNIYEACVPDRMHHIDLGLFKYQLEFTQDILKAVGGTELQKKFDDRLRQIPRFPGLKLLHKLGHLNVLTVSDYCNIMKIAFFVLDEIFEGNEITCKELCELYAKFSKIYIMSRKEMYTEGDLKIFEVNKVHKVTLEIINTLKIINYSQQLLIGALISKRSSLHCPLLTAIFRSYTVGVPAIRKYGALNGLLTETYETLYKSYVKIPYRLSNRKDVMRQLVNAVKHKELTSSAKKVIHCKAKKFGKVLWKLTLDNIDQKIKSLKKSENPLHSNFIEGLSQLISTLDTFLDTSSQESESDEFYIKIYDSVHLENRHILRTTGEFQGKEWFSNIVVTPAEDQEQYNLDEGAWYGKVLLLFKFFRGFFKEPYELALVRWFDIIMEEPELYGYPQLYYTKKYNTIPISSINQEVHIVPRFGKVNRYLLNKYMF